MVEGLLRSAETKDESDCRPHKVKLRRLVKKDAVQNLFQRGKKFITSSFVIFSLENDGPDLLYAIHTRKKLGPSVERNRIKRIYREVLRRNKTLLRGHQLIIIPRSGSKSATQNQLADQMSQFFSQSLRRK